MQYIKAKYMKQGKPTGRAYSYKTSDEVQPGDIVTDSKGSKLVVVDEPVDAGWIMTYGAEKLGEVKKFEEPTKAESEDNDGN
ncbi:MAG: hypothetical protein K6G30_03055 [Acetatifactor sp.]|nr:hypothetical protein [Acetatifactor sp.]